MNTDDDHKAKKLLNKKIFMNAFVSATAKTFKIQAQTELEPADPYVKGSESETDYFIAAVLSFADEKVSGSVSLAFTEHALLTVNNRLFGEEEKEFKEEMRDAVGEILNIIYGNVKKELNSSENFSLPMSIPQVVMGNSTGYNYKNDTIIALPFKFDDAEQVFVEILLKSKEEQ